MGKNNVLANAICTAVKRCEKRGLVEVPLPTGFGKTYAVMQAISMMTGADNCSYPDVKRIIFTTTLKKNLPIEKLRKCYKGDFDKEVLLLKSNVDSLIDFHADGGMDSIPEKFKDEAFYKMYEEWTKDLESEWSYKEDVDQELWKEVVLHSEESTATQADTETTGATDEAPQEAATGADEQATEATTGAAGQATEATTEAKN